MSENVTTVRETGKMVTGILSEYVDSKDYLKRARAILDTVGNLRLVGETGTGKTMLTHAIAEQTKLPLYEVVLTSDMSRWDLIGSDILEGGQTKFRDGIVVKWLKNPEGGICYVDGCNYGQPSIFSLYECIADFRGSVYVPEVGKEFVRTKNHYLVISFNPAEKIGYAGTFIQNIATMRRFEGLIVDYLEIDEETNLVQGYVKGMNDAYDFSRKFVEIANKTRELYRRGKLKTPLTTGNVINYAKLYKAGLEEEDIIEIAKSLFPEEQWTLFTRLFEDSKPLDINNLKRTV
jgi:MoxR-like ATPase